MKITIEWTYKTPKGTEAVFRSEEMEPAKALLIVEDLEKTGRVKNMTLLDSYDSTWMVKELKKYVKEVAAEPHNITLYFDGGFDVQSRTAGLGCVIYYEKDGKSYRLRKNAAVSQLLSNNEAEYAALHFAIKELEFMRVHHMPIRIMGDSQVVINQLNGEWPAYEKDLAAWADRIDALLNDLGITPEYGLIPRKENAEADRLASQALEEIDIDATLEITD